MKKAKTIIVMFGIVLFAGVIAPPAGRVAAGPAVDANALLLAENKALRGQVASLQEKNRGLAASLNRQTGQLKAELAALKRQNDGLEAALNAEIAALQKQNDALEAELARLKPGRIVSAPNARTMPTTRPRVKRPQSNDAKMIHSPVIVKVGKGQLRVRFQFTTLYIPTNIPKGDDILVRCSRARQCGYSQFFFVGYRQLDAKKYKKPTEGFVRVDGKAVKLECRSSDKGVVRIIRLDDDDGLCLEALTPGKVNILVSLAGHSLAIPVRVVQIPVRTGDYHIEKQTKGKSHTRKDVIKILGLPDKREELLIGWPKSVFYAGQHFSPPAGGWWQIQRWKYVKYPGAEIIFVGNSSAYYARSAQTFEVADAP